MITKNQSINYTKNALLYAERGGELLHSHKCFGDAQTIYHQMKENEAFNTKTIKKSMHIKIRIAPEDKGKLSTQDWIDISQKYALKIGFHNNPYAVYIHEENSEKEHIHIVASRIKEDNKAVSDSFTHYKNMDFSRQIEAEYNLRKVKRKLEKIRKQEIFKSSDKRILKLKELIEKAINISDNLPDFIFHLEQQGVKVKKGRGISFIDKDGAKFKGSQIGRKLSLKNIEHSLQYNQQIKRENQQEKGMDFGIGM